MDKIFIITVDDQREVLDAILQDLTEIRQKVEVEECESAHEAFQLMEEIYENGDHTAVVISDHIMPEQTGVQFLSKLKKDHRFQRTKKILLTGLATHQDTIEAINQADINQYIEKPWSKDHLVEVVKTHLTKYILQNGIDYQPYSIVLDQKSLLDHFQKEN